MSKKSQEKEKPEVNMKEKRRQNNIPNNVITNNKITLFRKEEVTTN